jgi:hypothetical protein
LLKVVARIERPAGPGPILPTEEIPEPRIWHDNTGGIAAYVLCSNGTCQICFPGFASYAFEGGATDNPVRMVVRPARETTRQQAIDRLRRNVVPLLLQARGFQLVHASAVRLRDGVVGLCGASFSGKSTLAAALAKFGLEIWADDSLLVCLEHDVPMVLKTPDVQLRLRSDSKAFFGKLDSGQPDLDDSANIELSFRCMDMAPLEALYLIRRDGNMDQSILLKSERILGHQAFTEILRQANYFNLEETKERRRLSEICLTIARAVPIYNFCYCDGFSFLDSVAEKLITAFDRDKA